MVVKEVLAIAVKTKKLDRNENLFNKAAESS